MLPDSTISFGLTRRDADTIFTIFRRYEEVVEVHIFGSRAKGTYKPASDIDLAVVNSDVSDQAISRIMADLADSSLPYTVDLINYPSLTNADLKAHIYRVGKVFYKR